MKLIAWNLNKRRAIEPQVSALVARQPDVIALQEVSQNNRERLKSAFSEVGYPYALDSWHDEPLPRRPFVMIVSHHPLYLLDMRENPYAQGVISAHVEFPFGAVEVHNIHVPSIGSYELGVKIGFMEAVYAQMAVRSSVPRILCGDFNSPMRELENGQLITFGQRQRADGTYVTVKGWERMEAAERGLLEGLRAFDLHDVYRAVHGYAIHDASWYAKNKGREFGFRLDHVLASAALKPRNFCYLHDLRQNNLSDHAAAEAVFAIDQG